MGWAKYFEDIQKLRDHAASLNAENFDHERAIASPERAILELTRVKEDVFEWSEGLIQKLDEILDQATDPEIDRQLLLEEKDKEISQIYKKIESLKNKISELELIILKQKERLRDNFAFHDHMAQEGARPLRR